MGIRSSGRSPLNYEPAISPACGGSEPQTEAPKVKSNGPDRPQRRMGVHWCALRLERRRNWGGGRPPTSPHSSTTAVRGCGGVLGTLACARVGALRPYEGACGGGKYERSVRRWLMIRLLMVVSGEFFRTAPGSGPSLCRGSRHGRLQVASRTRPSPCTRPHASQEREPTLSST